MFLPPSIQTQLSCLWNILSCDGIASYQAIEQLSYLLVLKLLEVDSSRSSHTLPPALHWSALLATGEDELPAAMQGAMAWLRTCDPGTGQLFHSAAVHFSKPSLLREAMTLLDDLFAPARPREVHAHMYQALLSRAEEAAAAWAAPGGKFYTPHHLAHLLCSLVRPQPGERMCDFACGNGRLLASAYTQITRTWCNPDQLAYAFDGQPLPMGDRQWSHEQRAALNRTHLVGIDNDSSAALQAWVLLRCLGSERPAVFALDALSKQAQLQLDAVGLGQVDVLLANPPYGSVVDRDNLAEDLRGLGTTKAELLFLQLAFRLLRPGGRAAIIVPDSVLFNRDKATVALRQQLVRDHCLHAVISLPKGAFAPYTNVKTSILVFTHSGETRDIWWYNVEADGYSLDKHRRPTPERNDLPDLIVKYSLRFAQDFACCRPSAFIDDDTALQWENIEPERQAYHYAQPVAVLRQIPIENEPQALLCFDRTLALPVTEPKAWEARVDQLADSLILLPGGYQPDGGVLAFAKNQRPGYPPDYSASHRAATKQTPQTATIVPNATQGSGQQDALTLYYLPGVKDLSSLQGWYASTLCRLHQLRVQEDFSTKRLLFLLRLLHVIYQRHYAAYQINPPEDGDTPLTPIDVQDASAILPWFRGAIRTLQNRMAQGKLSQQQFQQCLLVLCNVKAGLERQYGRVTCSPLLSRVALQSEDSSL